MSGTVYVWYSTCLRALPAVSQPPLSLRFLLSSNALPLLLSIVASPLAAPPSGSPSKSTSLGGHLGVVAAMAAAPLMSVGDKGGAGGEGEMPAHVYSVSVLPETYMIHKYMCTYKECPT